MNSKVVQPGTTISGSAVPAQERVLRFTPGPWQQHDDMTPDGRCKIIADVDGEYVDGSLHTTYKTVAICENEYGERLINAVHNARLIAAAPELLEMLKTVLNIVAQPGAGSSFIAPGTAETAWALVAKATGQ